MKTLLPVIDFAHTLHAEAWSASDIPQQLGALLLIEKIAGISVLGLSCKSGGRSIIALDERLVGTNRYVPTLGHECAHLVLHGDGIRPCVLDVQNSVERNAWFGAALLTVPLAMIEAFEEGVMAPADIAAECLVPLRFVELRYALAGAVENESAMTRHAANVALDHWMEYLRLQ